MNRRLPEAIAESLPESNPFASRRVRPGAIPFQFPSDGVDSKQLLSRYRQLGWRASIVGPHGSGKSTLLATLTHDLISAGHTIQAVVLHDRQRWLPREFLQSTAPSREPRSQRPAMIVVVDGYEQLNYWNRIRLAHRCHAANAGLLITAHAPTKLPILFKTTTSFELSQQIVEYLLLPSPLEGERSGQLLPSPLAGEGPGVRGKNHAASCYYESVSSPLPQASSLKPQASAQSSFQPSRIGPADIHRAWTTHHGNVREMLFELYDLFERGRMLADANRR